MKPLRKCFPAFFCLLFFAFQAYSQTPIHCLEDPILMNLLPQETVNEVARLRNKVIQKNITGAQTSNKQNCHAIYRIPVVFHVLHHRGPDSISAAQIQSQIQVLNEDYRKKTGTPGDGTGVDAGIEFYLATLDPFGNGTSGITYTDTTLSDFTYSASNDSALKAVIKWPQANYLNIWVVDTIKFMGSFLLGYAHTPSNGSNILDGVVLADQYVGRDTGTAKNSAPYNKGRTATHEVGHYLGLLHPFDYVSSPCEGDSAANCATEGDFVCDVPPHQFPHTNCNATFNTCTEFPKDTNDFLNNYMEYVNDTCMDMFSQGQATLMHNVLDTDSFRIILTSTQNLIQTGVRYHGFPDAFFMPMPPAGCAGDTIRFMDMSLGTGPIPGMPFPDSRWAWSFPGGSPDTSNLQNPKVAYNSPGNYTARLTISNSYGICTYFFPGLINISGANLSAVVDTVSMGNQTSFMAFADQPGTFAWNFGDGTGDSAATGPNPQYMYPMFGTWRYTMTFTPDDPTGCVAHYSDTALVLEFPLPLELLQWEGSMNMEGQVDLEWSLSEESIPDHFWVERAVNGAAFVPMARLDGNGSGEKQHWQWRDVDPDPGQNLYRLRMLDASGTETFSRSLEFRGTNQPEFQLFPNPTQGEFVLEMEGIANSPLEIVLRNLLGEALVRETIQPGPGVQKWTGNLSGFPAGIFLLEVRNPHNQKILHRARIVKTIR